MRPATFGRRESRHQACRSPLGFRALIRRYRCPVAKAEVACSVIGFLVLVVSIFALTGCGGQQTVKPRAIAFEPTIVACSVGQGDCIDLKATLLRESREARRHRCPANRPDVLVRSGGTLVCVANLSPAGSTGRARPVPHAVDTHGAVAIASFRAGEVALFQSGCLACHRLGEAGNRGPGSDLTHVGSRLSSSAIDRALVATRTPMPAFSGLPNAERRNLVYFLSQLR